MHITFLSSENLRHKGVECYFNNKRLVSSVHIIIFCVLPSQMPSVAEEIKDSLSPSKIVICPFSSLSLRWLSQMLHSSNMIWPQLHWSGGSANSTLDYNYNIDVSTALENRETLLATCPIGVQKEGMFKSIIVYHTHTCSIYTYTFSTQCAFGFSTIFITDLYITSYFPFMHQKAYVTEQLLKCSTAPNFFYLQIFKGVSKIFYTWHKLVNKQGSRPCLNSFDTPFNGMMCFCKQIFIFEEIFLQHVRG